jgi:serine/threonine protein kinase
MSDKEKGAQASQILIFKKYNLIQNIGGGAFGTVFLGENVWTREKVAIKIEERKNSRTTLEREAFILYYLKGPGLPEVKSFGKTKKYNILVQTLLGKSLYEIFNECEKKFATKDICMIGIQILERLEYIHSKNYIHRDIKPHNFLVGDKDEGLIYIIDFGLAKKFKSDRGNHVKFSITKHITGTPRFCSVNAMRGVEQSRRDDLESLCYLIIYFFKGFLPWQGLKISSRAQRFETITKMKKNIKIENLCEDLPTEIILFCKYTKKIGFTDNPRYEYMKNLFISVLNKFGYKYDNKFSWIKDGVNINNQKKIQINYHFHRNSPYKRLYHKIQNSLAKKREKQKDNNDYTLNTIYMENNNNPNNISELNELQKKNIIQSNDNNVLQNNLFQLNIDNYKHSYNYPLVVYNNKLVSPKENDFNKIAETFKGNDDSNLVQENKINIPDKISIIDATKSNLTNFQISNNQMFLFQENSQNKRISNNKTIKLHDYIRQEEKDGGVIGKDYDFKENDYFKINTPLFNSEFQDNIENAQKNDLLENNTKPNNNSLNIVNDENKSIKDLNFDNNAPIKTSNDNMNKGNENMKINMDNNYKLKVKTEENILLGKYAKKCKSVNPELDINNINNLNLNQFNNKNNIKYSINNNNINNISNKNIKDGQKNAISNSQNYIQKYEPFFIKHATINLNNTENFLKNFNKEKPIIGQDINNSYLINSEKKNNSINYEKLNEPQILFNSKSPKNYNNNNNYMNGPNKLNKITNNKKINFYKSNNSMNLLNPKEDNKFNNFIKINNNKIIKNNTQSRYRNTNNRNTNRNNNIIKFPISIRNKNNMNNINNINNMNYDISSEIQKYNFPSMLNKNINFINNNQMDSTSLKNKNIKNNIIINNVIIKNGCNIINRNDVNKTEIDNTNQISNYIKPDIRSNRIIMKNRNILNETEPFYVQK